MLSDNETPDIPTGSGQSLNDAITISSDDEILLSDDNDSDNEATIPYSSATDATTPTIPEQASNNNDDPPPQYVGGMFFPNRDCRSPAIAAHSVNSETFHLQSQQ